LSAPFDQGAFVEPTVIAGLPPTHRCSVEEIFGPVVTVHQFSTDDEVLGYANNTQYGLAGSIWTSNLNRAHRIARDWQTGMVWINCWLHRDLRVPFGSYYDEQIYHALDHGLAILTSLTVRVWYLCRWS
jgi:aminomuconate-semialdehyde/2-hydroxymuconate-6-semialdehyde dehydrogenase